VQVMTRNFRTLERIPGFRNRIIERMNELKELTDSALMYRIAEKDELAFQELRHRYLRDVLNFDLKFLQNPNDAEDAVQEKFIRIWRLAGTYEARSGSKVRNFILKIDRNVCIDIVNRRWRKQEMMLNVKDSDGSHGYDDILDYLEFTQSRSRSSRNVLHETLEFQDLVENIFKYTKKEFHSRQFLVFWGYIDGMSYREIAATYDMQLGSVRGYIARSFKRIRETFGDEWRSS